MAVTCITFDLDDTLWESGPVLANAEAKFYEWIERTCPDIAHTHSYDALVAHRHAHYASIPEVRHDLTRARVRWLESLLQEWGYGSDLAETGFRVFWEHRNTVTLFDDVPRVLAKLGERYAIGAITNGNADVHHIGIGHHFDFVVTPAEAGAAKPDSAIFEFALHAAGASPESVVHVGDDPMRDVAGAAALGLRTVWMNPEGHPWPEEGHPWPEEGHPWPEEGHPWPEEGHPWPEEGHPWPEEGHPWPEEGHPWPEETRPDAEISSLGALICIVDAWN